MGCIGLVGRAGFRKLLSKAALISKQEKSETLFQPVHSGRGVLIKEQLGTSKR